jgi:hypothetical protein
VSTTLLRGDLDTPPQVSQVRFEVKQSEAKVKSIFSLFLLFFRFFSPFSAFFRFFSLNFRFTLIFSLNFGLFYLGFRFRFLVFRIEVNHVKSGFFFASKRNEIFASISNFASEAKVRAHPTCRDSNRYLQNLMAGRSCLTNELSYTPKRYSHTNFLHFILYM